MRSIYANARSREPEFDPWGRWGPLNNPKSVGSDTLPADLSEYASLALRVGWMLSMRGYRERNWTRFRLASSILREIRSGRRWTMNQRRLDAGCHSVDFRVRLAGLYEQALLHHLFVLRLAQFPPFEAAPWASCPGQGCDAAKDGHVHPDAISGQTSRRVSGGWEQSHNNPGRAGSEFPRCGGQVAAR